MAEPSRPADRSARHARRRAAISTNAASRPALSRPLTGLRQVAGGVQRRLPAALSPTRRSTPNRIAGLSPEAALHATRNFRLGVLNGVMFNLHDALLSPTLVLAWFISRLGAPNLLVGLLPAIWTGGSLLPQLIVASRVQGLPRVMHWYRRVGITRVVLMCLLAVTAVVLAGFPDWLLLAFFVIYAGYALCAGISTLPWFDMVNKMISPRRRGAFFGQRAFWGGLLALLAAGPIGAILSEQFFGLSFPYNFAILFGTTAVVAAMGVSFWLSMPEPAATSTAKPLSVRSLWRRGREALSADRDYRAFAFARILLSLATIADPFYVVYAKNNLGAPPEVVGLYLGALSVASLLSNFLWGPMSDRAGNRTLLFVSVCSVAAVPLSALVLVSLSTVATHALVYTGFALVFVLSGNALGASRVLGNNMMLAIAPPGQLPTYIGFLNTLLGVAVFMPVIGGALTDVVGYVVLFVLALGFAMSSLFAVRRMGVKSAV